MLTLEQHFARALPSLALCPHCSCVLVWRTRHVRADGSVQGAEERVCERCRHTRKAVRR